MSASLASRLGIGAMALLLAVAACTDAAVAPPQPPAVASVAVTPATQSLIVGQTVTLRARPRASSGQELDRVVTWSSENELLATVSSSGVVATLALGEVGILATSEGKVGRAVLTIQPVPAVPVADVRLSVDEEIVLAWDGETVISAMAFDAQGNELPGRSVEWQSNRTNVAAVNHGTISAINPGMATITAVIEGVPASVGVRVLEPPIVALSIEGTTTGLEVGDVIGFAAKITRANGDVTYGPVEWSSNAPAVIRVEPGDLWGAALAAVAEGEATITISRDGVTASRTLRVEPRPTRDLVFNRWMDEASEIFVQSLAGDGLVPVRVNAGNVSREPSPSPDGTQITFAVSQTLPTGEQQHDIYIVNRNGMNMRWLTRTDGFEGQPEWSPDGTRILFRGYAEGMPHLFTIGVDGTGTTNLTAGMDFTDKRDPAWSHDGTKIAFIGVRNSQHKVWVMNADGSGLVQVTTDPGYDEFPAFSPDGQRIAFTRHNTAQPTMGDDLMIVSVAGGGPTRFAIEGHQRNPAWSPDGRLIALSGTVTLGLSQHEIFTIRPDGTGLRLRTVNPAWGGGFNPAWIAR